MNYSASKTYFVGLWPTFRYVVKPSSPGVKVNIWVQGRAQEYMGAGKNGNFLDLP